MPEMLLQVLCLFQEKEGGRGEGRVFLVFLFNIFFIYSLSCKTCSGSTETDCLTCKIAASSVGMVKSILPPASPAAC